MRAGGLSGRGLGAEGCGSTRLNMNGVSCARDSRVIGVAGVRWVCWLLRGLRTGLTTNGGCATRGRGSGSETPPLRKRTRISAEFCLGGLVAGRAVVPFDRLRAGSPGTPGRPLRQAQDRLTTERLSRRNVGGGGCLYWRGEGRGRLRAEAGMPLEVWIIFMALVVVAVVVLPRILPPTGPTCTRCEGSGQRQRALARPVQARRLA